MLLVQAVHTIRQTGHDYGEVALRALLDVMMAHGGGHATGLDHHTCMNMLVLRVQVADDFTGMRSVRQTAAVVVVAQLRRLAAD